MITTQFHCSFATQSRWVFTYSTRCISTDSWLLLLMIDTLLKQSIDALILRTGYKTRTIETFLHVYTHTDINTRIRMYTRGICPQSVLCFIGLWLVIIRTCPYSVLCSEFLCYTISSTVGLIASIFQQVCSILWATCICLSKY